MTDWGVTVREHTAAARGPIDAPPYSGPDSHQACLGRPEQLWHLLGSGATSLHSSSAVSEGQEELESAPNKSADEKAHTMSSDHTLS